MTKEVHSLSEYIEYIERDVARRNSNGGSKIFFDISVRFMSKNMIPNLKTYLEGEDFFEEIEIRPCPLGFHDIILRW